MLRDHTPINPEEFRIYTRNHKKIIVIQYLLDELMLTTNE
jgi:hypothetical protein